MQASALPPPDQLPSKVRAAAEAAARWTTERATATAAREAATHAIPVAERADVQAAAEALRAGKPDPGAPRADKAKAAREVATRLHTVVSEALDQAEVELGRVVATEAAAWRNTLEKQATAARDEYIAAVDAMAAARRDWILTAGTRSWLADPASRFDARRAEAGGFVRALATPNGSPPAFLAVVGALRADVDPPMPRSLATPTQSQPMPQAARSY